MTATLEKRPAIGNIKSERIKLIFEGHHTLEEKACMFMQGIALLEHKCGIYRAGVSDLWIARDFPENRRSLPAHSTGDVTRAPCAGSRN